MWVFIDIFYKIEKVSISLLYFILKSQSGVELSQMPLKNLLIWLWLLFFILLLLCIMLIEFWLFNQQTLAFLEYFFTMLHNSSCITVFLLWIASILLLELSSDILRIKTFSDSLRIKLSPGTFIYWYQFSSVQLLSHVQLCNPMNRSTPGLTVHHQHPEFTQTHTHRVSDAIQLSHPLSSPSPPVPNPSQHQGLFQWVSSLHEVAKVLEFLLQHQSFQWTPRTDLLQDGLAGSPWSPRDSQESSPTRQFKSINFSVLCFLYSPTLTSIHEHRKNHSLDQMDLCWQSNVSAF